MFSGKKECGYGKVPPIGVILVNLGTPDAPTKKALKPYLKEFLADPRVIEKPRWLWWIILNCFILPFRPKKSAELYKQVWTKEGSPLLVYSQKQKEKLEQKLTEYYASPCKVALGMSYGNPSVKSALEELRNAGCRKVVFLSLFPQYSATSSATAYDAIMRVFLRWRWIPDLRTITSYHDHPLYINALANSIRKSWQEKGKSEKLLFTFHGIPLQYFLDGDPYHCLCHKTARLVAEELELKAEEYIVTFQSIFGRDRWLEPATDKTMEKLGSEKLSSLTVICPGFISDCLETLEEIEGENKEIFQHAGGGEFRYVPCLNDSEDCIDLLFELIKENSHGWLIDKQNWDQPAVDREVNASKCAYEKLAKVTTNKT